MTHKNGKTCTLFTELGKKLFHKMYAVHEVFSTVPALQATMDSKNYTVELIHPRYLNTYNTGSAIAYSRQH